MAYSREIRALDTGDSRQAMAQLLRQLNLVQTESEQQLRLLREQLRQISETVQDINTRLAAMETQSQEATT